MAAPLWAVAVVLLMLGTYVARARAAPVNRRFAASTLALTGWVTGIAGVEMATATEFWGRLTFASAALIPASFLAFAEVFPSGQRSTLSPVCRFALATAGGFALLALTTPLVAHSIARTEEGITRLAGPAFPAFVAYMVICSSTSIAFLARKWARARGMERGQLQYLVAGMMTLAGGAITTNLVVPLITGRSNYSSLGPYFSLPLVLLVGHSIIRHRLMDLRLVVHRGVGYISVAASLSIFGLLTVRLLPSWHPSSVTLSIDIVVVLVVGVLMLSPFREYLFARFFDRYLYRRRLDHGLALRAATHTLTRLMQPEDFARELHTTLAQAFFPDSICIFACGDGGTLELLHPAENPDPHLVSALASILAGAPSALIIPPPDRQRTNALRQLHEAGAEVVLTLGRRGAILGAVLIGPRRCGDPYFSSDLAFLHSLSELASIAVENALFYRQRLRMLEYSERLLESIDSAVVAADESGRLMSLNPAARRLFQISESRAVSLGHLPSQIGWALALTARMAWITREAETMIEHLGGPIPVMISTAVLRGESGHIEGALLVATNLSTIKELEKNQRRLEHFATMARFYAGVAHEIRSPLSSISNFVSMLSDRFDDPDFREAASRIIPAEISRIVKLADRLRSMAPSESGTLSPVCLSELLRDITTLYMGRAEERGFRLTLVCPSTLPFVLGDPNQLIQLLVNILNNAFEAMPNGGVVTIEAAVRYRPTGDEVIVSILDEGTGIDAAIRPKVFEPFFTTKPLGSGLGLAICKEIADFHRATLTLGPRQDRPGAVATVEFRCGRNSLVESSGQHNAVYANPQPIAP